MAAGDSSTSICNIGLIAIGEDPIASLADRRKSAILCNARYDQVRRELLRAHPWGFAKKKALLAASTTAPAFGYANAFPLPADYIRVLNLPDNDRAEWEIIGGNLETDEGTPLKLLYVYDHQDPTRFDPIFVAALGFAIAAELAQPMRQSQALEQQMLGRVEAKLALARNAGAQENSPKEWDEDVLLRSRT